MFLLEYEPQMVRAEQEKQKGVLIDNTPDSASMQREVHFWAACLITCLCYLKKNSIFLCEDVSFGEFIEMLRF